MFQQLVLPQRLSSVILQTKANLIQVKQQRCLTKSNQRLREYPERELVGFLYLKIKKLSIMCEAEFQDEKRGLKKTEEEVKKDLESKVDSPPANRVQVPKGPKWNKGFDGLPKGAWERNQ